MTSTSGPLFGAAATRGNSKNLVEFRAGKMNLRGNTVHPDTRKGLVYVHQGEDSLMHFCWKDRNTGKVEEVRSPVSSFLVYFCSCTFEKHPLILPL